MSHYTRSFIVNIETTINAKVYAIFAANFLLKKFKKYDVEVIPPHQKDKTISVLFNDSSEQDAKDVCNILKGIELGIMFGKD